MGHFPIEIEFTPILLAKKHFGITRLSRRDGIDCGRESGKVELEARNWKRETENSENAKLSARSKMPFKCYVEKFPFQAPWKSGPQGRVKRFTKNGASAPMDGN
jgi:hypothetical protein